MCILISYLTVVTGGKFVHCSLVEFIVYFKQWLPDECITIETLVESTGEKSEVSD